MNGFSSLLLFVVGLLFQAIVLILAALLILYVIESKFEATLKGYLGYVNQAISLLPISKISDKLSEKSVMQKVLAGIAVLMLLRLLLFP